jgi:hypothetical protein
MAAPTLTTTSVLQCPHGGTVEVVSTNTRAKAGGAFMATSTDVFTITGCTGPVCVTAQWTIPNMLVRVNGVPSLSALSLGTCFNAAGAPTGPVVVVTAEAKVAST